MTGVKAYRSNGSGVWLGLASVVPILIDPPVPGPGTPSTGGLTQPSSSTTGVGSTVLSPVTNGGSDFSPVSGSTYNDKDFSVRVLGAPNLKNVTFNYCRFRGLGGRSSSTGLADLTQAGIQNITFNYCTFVPDTVSVWWDAIIGHDYTARHCEVFNTVDGFGIFNTHAPAGNNVNVTLEYNYVHDLSLLSPDPEHSDLVNGKPVGWSHNDGVQIQGGGNIRIYGNYIQDNSGPKSNFRVPGNYYPYNTGQAVGITPNVSPIFNVYTGYNWLGGGAYAWKAIPGSKGTGTGLITQYNRFLGSKLGDMYVDNAVTVQGVSAATAVDTVNGNVKASGSPISIVRGTGS